MTLCKAAVIVYLVAALLALLAIPASAWGLFGLAADPLSAVPAITLGMPWSTMLLGIGGETSIVLNFVLLAASLVLNAVILGSLCVAARALWRRARR